MKLDANTIDPIRAALAAVCAPEQLTVVDIERFAGATAECPGAAVFTHIRSTQAGLPPAELQTLLGAAFPVYLQAAGKPRRKRATAGSLASLLAGFASGLLQARIGLEIAHGSREVDDKEACFWFETFLDGIGSQALTCALVGVGAVLAGAEDPAATLAPWLDRFERSLQSKAPTESVQVLIEAARKRDIPVLQIAGNYHLWQFGWGARSERFWWNSSDSDGVVGYRILGDKALSKSFFRQLGLPVPAGRVVGPKQDPGEAARRIGFPCAIKPLNGGGGRGVTAGVQSPAGLGQAVALARQVSPNVLIEAHVPGEDYRLMVVDGELAFAVNRRRPSIQGDGTSKVRDLIDRLNAPRLGSQRKARFLKPIKDDEALAFNLARQGLTQESVVPDGTTIFLRSNANLSTGGSALEVLDSVHPQVRAMALHLAASLGQRAIGIDYITPDITRSPAEAGGGFIEANPTPGMDVLIAGGNDEDRCAAIILGARPGRIPAALILFDGESEALGRAIQAGMQDGIAAAGATWARIGPLDLQGRFQGPLDPVRAVLHNVSVQRCLVAWSHEDLAAYGLPLDSLDLCVVLGEPPPEPWLTMLNMRSKQSVAAQTPEEAVRICLGTAG